MKAALLPDRGVVKVAGDEARTFLNGLLTSDVTQVTPQSARYAALLTPQGKISGYAPQKYRGLDRFVAREQVLTDLDAQGLVVWVEAKKIMVPYDEKTKQIIIEPFLTFDAEPFFMSLR